MDVTTLLGGSSFARFCQQEFGSESQRVEIWKERAGGLIGRPGCLQFIHQLVPAQAAVDPVIWVAKHPNSAWLYLRNKYLL